MGITKEDMLIFVDSVNNNNKFYHMKLNDDGSIDIEYGRVGNNGQKTRKTGGEREYNKVMREKTNKGYEVSNISLENNTKSTQNFDLLELAMSQIEHSDGKVKELINRLVQKNIHNITSSTKISFNKDSNLFMTPLGPVTSEGISRAKSMLGTISQIVKDIKDPLNDNDFITANENYFKIIPTKISNLRIRSSYMLTNQKRIDEQFNICDTLEQTLKLMLVQKDTAGEEKPKIKEEVFKVKINLVDDKKVIKRINDNFNKSKNSSHGATVNNLSIENIYEVKLGREEENFRKDLSNVWELWHGTRVVNILSILKSGLLMPKETPGQTTGAMFSTGLYFSDQSTKSLNYCDGMLWNNSSKQDKIYMFVAEVAMGNYQVPKGPTSKRPDKGYDSYFAKANESGVRNNEMIVFDVNQVRLRYILEIK
jgi:poly [ADP-ribose] polymerase